MQKKKHFWCKLMEINVFYKIKKHVDHGKIENKIQNSNTNRVKS